MSYVIGFDLGTHQTKVCIQDASNPAEKTYEFFRFPMPDGNITYLFPSVVQINKDHTLSYGYTNEEDCLISGGTSEPKPSLELLSELPKLQLPQFIKPKNLPSKPKFDPWFDNLRRLKGEKTELDKWEEECKKLEQNAFNEWEKECSRLQLNYYKAQEEIRQQNETLKKEFNIRINAWEKASIRHKLIFRYFKLHALTNTGEWPISEFSSKEITVWYVAYILLTIREKYGKNISVQFGVPCGATNSRNDKIIIRRAYEIFVSAADLINNFSDTKEYSATSFESLRELTLYKKIDDQLIDNYYFEDIPEAFASLVAVTLQKKLGMGFHLLVDIGGGTTYLALFCVSEDNSPDVLYVSSFPKGINSILENAKQHSNQPIEILQTKFLQNRRSTLFYEPINFYKDELTENGYNVINVIIESFKRSKYHHGRDLSELDEALHNQPVIFGGGGGSFPELHTSIVCFNDPRTIDRSMLSIHNLLNYDIDDNLFTILATSYGLASYEKPIGKGIECTDIMCAFNKFLPHRKNKNSYHMAHDRYHHGLSDT